MKQYNDKDSRNIILNNFTETLFVEAGAGTGKTTAMVGRIILSLANGLAPIDRIVAITFTNEGAASLRTKIQAALENAILCSSFVYDKENYFTFNRDQVSRLQVALSDLSLASFCTIHSFCVDILKARPIEAGLDPAYSIESGDIERGNSEEIWVAFLFESTKAGNSPFIKFIVENNLPVDEIKEIFLRKLGFPDLELYSEEVDAPDENAARKVFSEISRIAKELRGKFSPKSTDADKLREEYISGLVAKTSNPDSMSYSGIIKFFTEYKNQNLKWGVKTQEFQELQNQVESGCAEIRKQYYDFLHSGLRNFITEFESSSLKYKKKKSVLNFDDLLMMTGNLLKNSTEVREYFKKKFAFLLIDEMQDTDPLQTEIVFFLAEKEGHCSPKWDIVELQPGKLFMVGDPKQSIYKFRRADIQIYEKAKAIIQSQGGLLLNLTNNFRSGKPIIDFINNHFTQSFNNFTPHIKEGVQAKYIPLETGLNKTYPAECSVYVISTDSDREFEAAKITRFIQQIVNNPGYQIPGSSGGNRNIEYRDITLLFKDFMNITSYTRGFEEKDIPFFEVGGKTFFYNEQLRALAFSLKAISDPSDTIALYAALRSPLFGFSDKDLFEFTRNKKLSLFCAKSNDDKNSLIGKAILLMLDLHKIREEVSPSEIIKRILDSTGICHLAIREPNGIQLAANILRLLEYSLQLETETVASYSTVIAKLMKTVDSTDNRIAAITVGNTGKNAVRLMTIHKAKGLEAPVIILADAYAKENNSVTPPYTLRNERKVIIPLNEGGYYSKDIGIIEGFEVRKSEAESERLRYVAATRAQYLLAVCVSSKTDKQNNPLLSFNNNFFSSLYKSPNMTREGITDADLLKSLQTPGDSTKAVPGDKGTPFLDTRKGRLEKLEQIKGKLASFDKIFESVHDQMDQKGKEFWFDSKSRGKEFGKLLHQLMEHYIKEPGFNIDAVLDLWMSEHKVPGRFRTSVLSSYKKGTENPFVIEAKQSDEVYSEWEYYLKPEGNDAIVNGIIDLVYKSPLGEWVVIDFKTDDISDPTCENELRNYYFGQIDLYANHFEQLTENKVAKKELVFI